ncbi:MAG: cell division topological specificity factor MinE [Dictyoglomus sp. NZ13-RE01]|nr:MAG: cell division topological specificity factor MinE [Dictyoglomus sp. NZ13-RE01]
MLSAGRSGSAAEAKRRLSVMVIYDRAGLEQGAIDSIKEDIIKIISKYSQLDTENIEVNVSSRDNQTVLRIDIPLRN